MTSYRVLAKLVYYQKLFVCKPIVSKGPIFLVAGTPLFVPTYGMFTKNATRDGVGL